jgi:hypothetical protein
MQLNVGVAIAPFRLWHLPMTLRIERMTTARGALLKVCGQIRSEDLEELQKQLDSGAGARVMDLDELALVDVEVVRFLGACEGRGIEVVNCPPYIREWMKREAEKK